MKPPVDQARRLQKPPTGGGTGRKAEPLIVITIDANKPIPQSTLDLLRRFVPVSRLR